MNAQLHLEDIQFASGVQNMRLPLPWQEEDRVVQQMQCSVTIACRAPGRAQQRNETDQRDK